MQKLKSTTLPDDPTDKSVENLLEHTFQHSAENDENAGKMLENILEHSNETAREAAQLLEHNLTMGGMILEEVKQGQEKQGLEIKKIGEQAIIIQATPGKPGEPGKTPVKGEDYFTDADKADIVEQVYAKITKPEDGKTPKKGVDYFTAQEIDSIIAEIKSKVQDGEDGEDGEDGQDGEAPSLQEIVQNVLANFPKEAILNLVTSELLLEKLKGQIKYEDVVGAPEFKPGHTGGGTGYLREITDVEVIGEPVNGQLLSWSAAKKKWVPVTVSSSSGGALTPIRSTETPDGIISVFTFPSKPTYIVSGGAWYEETDGWSWNAGTSQATMISTPPSSPLKLLAFA